ncbi:Nadh:flavin oxidoreductase nadh oxidase [Mycena sanguinolenta]|uniref:Nadh:flavin oxidoreductase nadh oxidase n=1 Tax=Mycena sanguinolenta TaxID=230812 RepID=A0A8H6XIF1_9AGAR|nr:Nadh:flavin oxidoreductase nadh oxidase [Mycena sanguinolenta]
MVWLCGVPFASKPPLRADPDLAVFSIALLATPCVNYLRNMAPFSSKSQSSASLGSVTRRLVEQRSSALGPKVIDQFLHDGSNIRIDKYGGACTRFPFKVVEAVGQPLRVSPWGAVPGMHFVDIPRHHATGPIRFADLARVLERKIWGARRRVIHAIAAAMNRATWTCLGANLDLPSLSATALSVGNRASSYYAPGSVDPKGYTDCPFAAAIQAHQTSAGP